MDREALAGCSVAMDTFVVRTLLVPSVMLLLKQRNWWPRKMAPVDANADRTYARPASAQAAVGQRHWPSEEVPHCQRQTQHYGAVSDDSRQV